MTHQKSKSWNVLETVLSHLKLQLTADIKQCTHPFKRFEFSEEFATVRDIFNPLLCIWKRDGTLFLVFDIQLLISSFILIYMHIFNIIYHQKQDIYSPQLSVHSSAARRKPSSKP